MKLTQQTSKPDFSSFAEVLNWSRACSTFSELLQKISGWLNRHCQNLGLWLIRPSDASTNCLTDASKTSLPIVENVLHQLATEATSSGEVRTVMSERLRQRQLVAAPLKLDGQPELVLAGFFDTSIHTSDENVARIQCAALSIESWCQAQDAKLKQEKSRQLETRLNFLEKLLSKGASVEIWPFLVNWIQRELRARQVAILKRSDSRHSLIGMANAEKIDLKIDFQSGIQIELGKELKLTDDHFVDFLPDSPLGRLVQEANATALRVIEVPDEDGISYRIAIFETQPAENHPQSNDLGPEFQGLVRLALNHARMMNAQTPSILDRIRMAWSGVRKSKFRQGVLAALAFIFLVPIPYQVTCPFELQPVDRRFVAAPYDGILEQVLVQQGDTVEPNQVLAIMDREKLITEKSSVVAEMESARKKIDAARGGGDIAASQIAKSEFERAQAELNLLDQRLRHLEIRAPIGGVVISGEVEKVEGAPVETGQSLFEIGPLKQLVAEVQIPERDLAMIQPGMQTTICCQAFPYESLRGALAKVQPRAETIDDEQVFIGEVIVENSKGKLKPGLQGRARVQSCYRPVIWRLFHRSYESFRYWLMW